jgi:transposase
VAAILSVIESCRRLAIPVRKYLADILPGLADTSIQNVTGLTPKAWAAKRSNEGSLRTVGLRRIAESAL